MIFIEDNALIGAYCKILSHEFSQKEIRFGKTFVGRNAQVGAFSVVRSGVKIGRNSCLAMCSLANKDIPESELWGGTPARNLNIVNK